AGLVDRCPRTHRVGTNQTERIAHAAAVELEAGVHAGDDQFGLAAKRPVVLARRLPYGDDRRGQDRTNTTRFFRAAFTDQGDRSDAVGVARDGAQGDPREGDRVRV